MIDHQALLDDLQTLLPTLEDDLRTRVAEQADLDQRLRAEHAAAREAGRSAQSYEEWREDAFTQSAVAWILACVFVRFLEDNELVEAPRLSGPGPRLGLARDHQTVFFQARPTDSERDYLHAVFGELGALPGMAALLDERHNPLWSLGLSGDGARRLVQFWQQVDPATGAPRHDFADPEWDTRFLGDLYQDLSAEARKRYALLQTPEFVEEFILDRTLTPAIDTFGWSEVRLIDPACGSGHFLLGAFRRLFALGQRHEPGADARHLAQRALEAVCGVDVNPYAVAIARFRLLLAALRAAGLRRLRDAPAFRIEVAVGDSLLHGKRWGGVARTGEAVAGVQRSLLDDRTEHFYASEDREALERLLGRRYHAVVGNPPYITVKDRALNDSYRQRYGSCHRQYSLAVPFMERLFELALPAAGGPAGFVGMITANSFMKREFGKKLIETFVPTWDLTHVVDTSGAYIPGHGTPTVILFGRNRRPVAPTVRAVMGIRGEPTTPDDPARGLVWTAITAQVDQPGSTSAWVSASDTPREAFERHPWSIGGGGAAELKELIEERAERRELGSVVEAIGRTTVVGEDDAWLSDAASSRRNGMAGRVVPLVLGECVRDWGMEGVPLVIYPYDALGGARVDSADALPTRVLWPMRTSLAARSVFGKSLTDMGRPWYEHLEHYVDKLRTPLSIAFAFVATHNHFVLDRGGKVFNRTAPVIKLHEGATEDDHLRLLGLLNSSVACFWMKQVFFDKGAQGINEGGKSEAWERFFEFDSTKVQAFPVCNSAVDLAREVDRHAAQLATLLPAALAAHATPTADSLRDARIQAEACRRRMIALQEDLDWRCYRLYGLLDDDLTLPLESLPEVALGERAFEIDLARRVAAGEAQTAWFERHGSTPRTEIPAHWPDDYRRLVERRLAAIAANPNVRLIEQPEYKRRWNSEPWEQQQERALRGWLLDRLETPAYWPEPELHSCARLADRAHGDAAFMQVAALYRGRADFDLTALVVELVEAESVPMLAALRYKDSGLRKRAQWERTWEQQRREDRGDDVGEIPVPPRYTSADFLKSHFWRLRGKLDVPKERFLALPGCERDADRTPVIGWAGWDHLQQAQALAAFYLAMKEKEGWPAPRLTPLLVALAELLPWLQQWHNAKDARYGQGMGDYFRDFMASETRDLGLATEALRTWKPATTKRGRKTKTTD
jgi:SAM-dependent methyltransferase